MLAKNEINKPTSTPQNPPYATIFDKRGQRTKTGCEFEFFNQQEVELEKVQQEIYALSKSSLDQRNNKYGDKIYTLALDGTKRINMSFKDDHNVGVCQLWGGDCISQETAIRGMALDPKSASFSDDDWNKIIMETCQEVEAKVSKNEQQLKQSSCFHSNIVIGDTIININMGNSESFLVTINANDAPAYVINKLHDANNKDEKNRVLNAGGMFDHKCLNGMIDVTRAFGYNRLNSDKDITKHLISHVPDITPETIGSSQTFLVMACSHFRDGMEYQNKKSFFTPTERLVANIIRDCKKADRSPEEMAKELAKKSIERGVNRYNASVVVIPVSDISLKTKTAPLCYFVADGRHGPEISHLLYNEFLSTLQSKIQSHLQKANNSKYSTAFFNNSSPPNETKDNNCSITLK